MLKFDEMLHSAINESDESAMAKLKNFAAKRAQEKTIAEKRKDLEKLFDDDFKMEVAASLLPDLADVAEEDSDRVHDEAYGKAEKLVESFIKQIIKG